MKAAILCGMMLLAAAAPALGDAKSKAAAHAAEYVLQKFGAKAAAGGVSALARKIEVSAARHGPDVLLAVRKVGPRALPLVEKAGAHGTKAASVLARHGEGGALHVVSRPTAMGLVVRHGEGAAAAMVKHAGLAEPVIAKFGAPAVRAMGNAGPQAGRRLAMMAGDGTLAKLGRTEQVLEVVAKYGDRATAFLWKNKGALAVGTAMTAFLMQPEPFIDGTRDIAKVAAENVIRPLAEVPGMAVGGSVSGTNWTVVVLAGLAAAGAVWAARRARSARRRVAAPQEDELRKGVEHVGD
jgi:hypothetical protein